MYEEVLFDFSFKLSQIVDPFGLIVVALMNSREFVAHISNGSRIYEAKNSNNKMKNFLHSDNIGNIDVPFIAAVSRFKVFLFAIKLIQLDFCSSSKALVMVSEPLFSF